MSPIRKTSLAIAVGLLLSVSALRAAGADAVTAFAAIASEEELLAGIETLSLQVEISYLVVRGRKSTADDLPTLTMLRVSHVFRSPLQGVEVLRASEALTGRFLEESMGLLGLMNDDPRLLEQADGLPPDPQGARSALVDVAGYLACPFPMEEMEGMFAMDHVGDGVVEIELDAGAIDQLVGEPELALTAMTDTNEGFSLQYLQLQQKMQMDNQEYALLSAVLAAIHETAKDAINNIR